MSQYTKFNQPFPVPFCSIQLIMLSTMPFRFFASCHKRSGSYKKSNRFIQFVYEKANRLNYSQKFPYCKSIYRIRYVNKGKRCYQESDSIVGPQVCLIIIMVHLLTIRVYSIIFEFNFSLSPLNIIIIRLSLTYFVNIKFEYGQ